MNPSDFPRTRSVVPIQLEINKRQIFCKGSNWVNPEIFPGIIGPERYDELTDRAREANFNLLRIWGGGIVNKEAFHEQCDEKGIMVWQEFPLACNNYEDHPDLPGSSGAGGRFHYPEDPQASLPGDLVGGE